MRIVNLQFLFIQMNVCFMKRLCSCPIRISDVLKIFIGGILVTASCAGRTSLEKYRPLRGSWRTDREFIMTIRQSQENGVAAFIKDAPGYYGEDVRTGKAVITHILPLADGGYSGLFDMPGKTKPVKVKIVFSSPDTLLIVSWDRRVKGNIMKWHRVKKLK